LNIFHLHRDSAQAGAYGGAHGEGERVQMKRAEGDAGCPPPTYTGRPGGGWTVDVSAGLYRHRHAEENSGRAIM